MMAGIPAWVPAQWQTETGWGTWATWDLNTRLSVWRNHFGVVDAGWQNAIVRDFVSTHYGALASYLDHPEIGPVLMSAATQGWDETTFKARLAETQWYKTTNASQREWDLLSRSDPASATQRVDQMKAQIATLLSQEGVEGQFTDARITALATQFLRNGVPAEQIPKGVIAEVQYQPTAPVGKLGQTMSDIATLADRFVVPLSDQAKFDWAKKIESGAATQDGITEYLRQSAMGMFGSNQQVLDGLARGQDVKTLLDPQVQTIAQALEIDPESINLLDPKWAQVINFSDGSTTRLANLGETTKIVKGTTDYRQTATANREAATLAENLARTFGAA